MPGHKIASNSNRHWILIDSSSKIQHLAHSFTEHTLAQRFLCLSLTCREQISCSFIFRISHRMKFELLDRKNCIIDISWNWELNSAFVCATSTNLFIYFSSFYYYFIHISSLYLNNSRLECYQRVYSHTHSLSLKYDLKWCNNVHQMTMKQYSNFGYTCVLWSLSVCMRRKRKRRKIFGACNERSLFISSTQITKWS